MKINKIFFKIVLAIMIVALFGCTTIYPTCWLFGCSNKEWYGIIQREQVYKCGYEQSQKEADLCFNRQDKRPYEDYEIDRKRSGVK